MFRDIELATLYPVIYDTKGNRIKLYKTQTLGGKEMKNVNLNVKGLKKEVKIGLIVVLIIYLILGGRQLVFFSNDLKQGLETGKEFQCQSLSRTGIEGLEKEVVLQCQGIKKNVVLKSYDFPAEFNKGKSVTLNKRTFSILSGENRLFGKVDKEVYFVAF